MDVELLNRDLKYEAGKVDSPDDTNEMNFLYGETLRSIILAQLRVKYRGRLKINLYRLR
jgi:hypothetical protein